jgi:hypothetical protein
VTGPADDAAITYGNGKFVISVADTLANPPGFSEFSLFESTDGSSWNRTSLSSGEVGTKNVDIGFGEGHFILAVRNTYRNSSTLSYVSDCRFWDSLDAHYWSPMNSSAYQCGNTFAEVFPTRWHGQTLLFRSINTRIFESVDFGREYDIGFALNGKPSLTVGSTLAPTPTCPAGCRSFQGGCVCPPPPSCSEVQVQLPSVDCKQPGCPPSGSQTCATIPQPPITPCANAKWISVTYLAPSGHCSDISLSLWVTDPNGQQGATVMTSPAHPGGPPVTVSIPMPSNFVPDGAKQLLLNIQATGIAGGCNKGCLGGWGGKLSVSFINE